MLWLPSEGQTEKLTLRRARIADAPAIARVYVESWRRTYRGLLPDAYLDGLRYESFEKHWRRTLASRGWAFVAERIDEESGLGAEIVGMASGGRARRDRVGAGEIYVLYVDHAFHGQGVGRALFDACHYELATRGLANVFTWVLESNPSRKFYEHLGGAMVDHAKLDVGGREVQEVAYFWAG